MKNKFLVGYDIKKDKERRVITKILENYGIRWQYSVFCCDFSIADKRKVIEKFDKIINPKNDSVFIIPMANSVINSGDYLGNIKNTINQPSQPSFF